MTASIPHEVLAELSELIPERLTLIDMGWGEQWWAVKEAEEVRGWVSIGGGELSALRLEHMLRDECEARGWNWVVSRQARNPDDTWQYWGRIWHPFRSKPEVSKMAGTPTLAFVLALTAALRGAQ